MRTEWIVPYRGSRRALIRNGWDKTPLDAGLTILALYTAGLETPCAMANHGTDEFAMPMDETIREEASRRGLTVPVGMREARWAYFTLGHITVKAISRFGVLQVEIDVEEGCRAHSAFGIVERAATLLGITSLGF